MDVVLRGAGWNRVGEVAVCGRAFDSEDTLLEGPTLASEFADDFDCSRARDGLEAVATVAADLEGFFAAVITPESGSETYLVADGARSIPLYYDARARVVSDRGGLVRERTDAECDPVTESEFLLTRYVSGPETIWSGVYATQPGEVVRVRGDEDGITRKTYREYWPVGEQGPHRRGDAGDPSTGLRSGFEVALERLERVAAGRPVVVPLSGGYDSRLLAAALVDRGLEVIAFTFGRPGHPDVEVSREVAARLGIQWEFVPYTEAAWYEWYHGEAGRSYRERAFGGDALPFLAEWPAVRRLVAEGRVPDDALFCPGHTVATPSERLPRFHGERGDEWSTSTTVGCGPAVDADVETEDRATVEPSVDAIVEYVLETHYTLWEFQDEPFRAAARARIRRGLLGEREESAVSSPETAAAAYERWEWRGRMSTFTNGDLRVYEDAGVDWWLPLWDPAYVRAWERVPLSHRRGKALHAALALESYREAVDAEIPPERVAITDRSLEPIGRVLSVLRYTPEKQFTERGGEWEPPFLAPRSQWGERGRHPLAWDGVIDPDLYERLPAFRNLYALRVLAETGRLDLADPESPVPDGSRLDLLGPFENER